jgi:hypothetical protein
MMKATYDRPHTTYLSLDEAALAMRSALTEVLGEDPAPATLALALGKTALETGRWASMWNFNWGNIKASDKYEGAFTCITLNEVFPAGVTWFAPEGQLSRKGGTVIGAHYPVPDGHPQTRMRAHASAAEGALAYVRFVAGGRYSAAWKLLLAGDAAGYVHALKQAGYFTADEETYKCSVVSLQKELVTKLSGLPHDEPTVEVPPVDEVRSWLAPQDIAQLEAELADRYFDVLDMNRQDGLREMSEPDDDETTVREGKGQA